MHRSAFTHIASFAAAALLSLAILLAFTCGTAHTAERTLTVFAQAYTPDIVTGDNPLPLRQFSRLAREWEKMHPGVKVRFINQPPGDYRVWMITQLKGGTAPDVMWTQADWANEDQKYGWFIQLDPYLNRRNPYTSSSKPWIDHFYEDATNARRAPDGKLYALPIDQVETGIFYNKDIFRRVGVQPPETWSEFVEVHQKLEEAGYVAMLFVGDAMRFGWARTLLHDQLFNDKLPLVDVKREDQSGFLGVDAQEFVRAYKKGIWSVRDPRYRDLLRILKDWSQYWNDDWIATGDPRLFRVGRAAMFWEGSWYTPSIERDPLREFDYGVFPVPGLTRQTSRYAAGMQPRGLGGASAIQFAITQTAVREDKVDLAVDFLQFITAPGNLGKLVGEAEKFLPNSPGVKGSPTLDPFSATLEQGPVLFRGEPPTKEYEDVTFRAMQSYLSGKASLDDTITLLDEYVARAVDRLLKENPQWRFDENWEILPDAQPPASPASTSTSGIRWIPWVFVGIVGLASLGAAAINRREIGRSMRKKKNIYLFLVPTFLLLLLFNYYPIISAFYHAFFDWKGSGEADWVGLKNFVEVFRDPVMHESAVNALLLLGFGIVVSITLPLFVAELIFHLRSDTAKYLYRVLFVIPMVVPGIVTLLIWGFIFNFELGLLNQFFRLIGFEGWTQAWLGNPNIALYSMMFIGFPWVGGFALLIYYAGLQSIPKEVLESSAIDGASAWKRFLNVDLPLVMPQTKLLIVLGFINGLQGFQNQLILTNGGPGYSTMVPGMHLYLNAMSYDRMGYACAIGVVLFVVILALTWINLRYLKSGAEGDVK